ncbi:MAG: hypothetical protein AAB974_03940 [Patescibacteria group bacterium]
MVTNQESRRAAVKAELIAGITRCGGVVNGEQCGRIHGETVQSAVSSHSFTVVFSKAVVVDGLVVPLCAVCARKAGPEAVAIDEAVRLADQQLAATQVAPQAATPKAAPAPVIPVVGRLPAVRKDALASQPLAARKQPTVPRKDERKATKGGGWRREPQLSNSMKSHLNHLASSQEFGILFSERARLCSCGRCPNESGQGFATKNGDYAGKRFALCRDGVDAAIRTASVLRNEGTKPAFLIFRDVADWKRFDARIRDDAERSERRGQEILNGEIGNDATDTCAVFSCRSPKPTDRIAMHDAKHNLFVEHRICNCCTRAAQRLSNQLRQNGQRWAFQLLREGQKLSPRQQDDLRRVTAQLARKEPAAQRAASSKSSTNRTKPAVHPTPSVGKGTFGEKLVAAVTEAKKTKTAAPQPASAPSEPEAVAATDERADEPASDPTFASVPAAAPEAPTTPPEEKTMGGGGG